MVTNRTIQIRTNKTNMCPGNCDCEKYNDDHDYEYNDAIVVFEKEQIVFEKLFNLQILKHERADNYVVMYIDDGTKYSDKYLFLNLNDFTIRYQFFTINQNYYHISDYENNNITFRSKKYDMNYFFENVEQIVGDFEIERHTFDTTKSTLLLHIFQKFGIHVENNSLIYIDGFTFGMSCQDINTFKTIPRDHSMTLEKQLTHVLFKKTMDTHQIYDIDLTIKYNGNNKIRIVLACKNKEIKNDFDYGEFDDTAEIKVIT